MSDSIQLGVMGNPIAHSKSPIIHLAFARQQRANIEYDKILVPLDAFEEYAGQFFNKGGHGLNITVPFKEQALAFADRLTPRAQLAGAVNTLIKQSDESIIGDTTDGEGLVNDIVHYHHHSLGGKHILVLGAGGAVKGIIEPILAHNPACIVIANRTAEKARKLAAVFSPKPVTGVGLTEIPDQAFDWIINGTSAGLSGEVPTIPKACVAPQTGCYDMLYANEPTPFLRWAHSQGLTLALDGLGMLVEQAALSYAAWMQFKPDTKAVRQLLRG